MNCDCKSVKAGIKDWLWLAIRQNMYDDSTCTLSLMAKMDYEHRVLSTIFER